MADQLPLILAIDEDPEALERITSELQRYERETRLHRRRTAMFRAVQHIAGPAPDAGFHLLARTLGYGPLRPFFLRAYGGMTPVLASDQ